MVKMFLESTFSHDFMIPGSWHVNLGISGLENLSESQDLGIGIILGLNTLSDIKCFRYKNKNNVMKVPSFQLWRYIIQDTNAYNIHSLMHQIIEKKMFADIFGHSFCFHSISNPITHQMNGSFTSVQKAPNSICYEWKPEILSKHPVKCQFTPCNFVFRLLFN